MGAMGANFSRAKVSTGSMSAVSGAKAAAAAAL